MTATDHTTRLAVIWCVLLFIAHLTSAWEIAAIAMLWSIPVVCHKWIGEMRKEI